MTAENLSRLIEMARAVKTTPEDKEAQRQSFVYGNTGIENPAITQEMVAAAVRRDR